MSDILYSKLRLEVPQELDGENAIITSSKGTTRTVEMSSPITDVMVAGMEKYIVQAGFMVTEVPVGYGEIKKVKVNSSVYDFVRDSSDDISEGYWLLFLEEGGVSEARNRNETNLFLGKNVVLSNTLVSEYTSWKIADFNHDNSGNTVDLIQNNIVANYYFNISDNNTYNGSTVRNYLINSYYPAFSTNIKNRIQTMSVSSNGSTLSDKIKLLSGTEVGFSAGFMLTEGTRYPIFTNNKSRVRRSINNYWWLRSRYTSGSGDVYCVNPSGEAAHTGAPSKYNHQYGVVPCIRFA